MTAPTEPSKLQLLDLPDELLLRIVLHLDSRDRALCTLLCSRLAALGATSPELWQELHLGLAAADRSWHQYRPAKPAADHRLLPALARRHPFHRLRVDGLDAHYTYKADNAMASVKSAAAALAGSLTSVELCVDESLGWQTITVGEWVLPLRALTRLSLTAMELTVTDCLGTLPSLEALHLAGKLKLEPRSIPTCLDHLFLSHAKMSWLPPAVERASSLRTLHVRASAGRIDSSGWAPLDKLACLTELLLQGVCSLPAGLSTLTRLRRLLLPGGIFYSTPVLDQQLAGLAALRELDLSTCSLQQLPPALDRLRALEALDLRGARLVTASQAGRGGAQLPPRSQKAPLPIAWLQSLQVLALSPYWAAQLAQGLRAASQLQCLHLEGSCERLLARFDGAAVTQLCSALRHMPALRLLQHDERLPRLLATQPTGLQAFVGFVRACPDVEVRDCSSSKGSSSSTDDDEYGFTVQPLLVPTQP